MEKEKRSLFQRFLLWREKNIKEKQFILILSFLVGIFTAITALILKMLIHWIPLFSLSGSGNISGRLVCALCCEG